MSDKNRNNKDKRSPEEIERNIEGTREKLAEDLDDLGQKVSPENLKKQAKGTMEKAKDAAVERVEGVAGEVKHRTEAAGDRIVGGIKEEPLPVGVLLGVLAAGYVLMEARKSSSRGGAGGGTRTSQGTMRGEGYGSAAVVDRSGRALESGTHRQSEHDGGGMMETVKNNGLLLGIGALAAGAAVGLLLPTSSDSLSKAREKAREATDMAREKAREAGGKAREKMSMSGSGSQGTSSHAGRRGVQVRERIRVNRSAEELYRFWRDFENLPRIMSHLESVTNKAGKRSHWVAKGPLNTSVEWDAVITDERLNESIAWRSEPGSQVPTEGAVRFRSIGDNSTDIIVSLTYHPPAGALGDKVAKLFGADPAQQISDDLERFKEELESGRMTLGSRTTIGGSSTIGGTTA